MHALRSYPMLYKVDEKASAENPDIYKDTTKEWKGVVPEYVADLVLLSKRSSTQVCEYLQHTCRQPPPP